jgi:hypothetical protein
VDGSTPPLSAIVYGIPVCVREPPHPASITTAAPAANAQHLKSEKLMFRSLIARLSKTSLELK